MKIEGWKFRGRLFDVELSDTGDQAYVRLCSDSDGRELQLREDGWHYHDGEILLGLIPEESFGDVVAHVAKRLLELDQEAQARAETLSKRRGDAVAWMEGMECDTMDR